MRFPCLITAMRIGQVINQTIAVTLQSLDVAVLVICRYLFGIGTSGMSGIEQPVHTIVSEGIAMAYTICIPAHAADVAIIMATIS